MCTQPLVYYVYPMNYSERSCYAADLQCAIIVTQALRQLNHWGSSSMSNADFSAWIRSGVPIAINLGFVLVATARKGTSSEPSFTQCRNSPPPISRSICEIAMLIRPLFPKGLLWCAVRFSSLCNREGTCKVRRSQATSLQFCVFGET